MRPVSLLGNSKYLSIERTAWGDLCRRRWFKATLRRINLPEAVILTRLAIALCVFSFCFINSSFFSLRGYLFLQSNSNPVLLSSVSLHLNERRTLCSLKAQSSLSPEQAPHAHGL